MNLSLYEPEALFIPQTNNIVNELWIGNRVQTLVDLESVPIFFFEYSYEEFGDSFAIL